MIKENQGGYFYFGIAVEMTSNRAKKKKDTEKKRGKKSTQENSLRKQKKKGTTRRKHSKRHSSKQQEPSENSGRESGRATAQEASRQMVDNDFVFESCVHPSSSNQLPAQKKAFEEFVRRTKDLGLEGLVNEYVEKVKPYIGASVGRKAFDENMDKNRYKDVVCNDMTRVVLRDGKDGDYIHANYVRGLTPLYILTQGPLANTMVDFWRMIVQEKVSVITMLCDFIEMGKRKCETYYPTTVGEKMKHGDYTITCDLVDEQIDAHITQSILTVEIGSKTAKVTHCRMKTWPDKTVPKSAKSLLRNLYLLRTSPNAVVIHCSAGIGRTGTFVAVELCLQTIFNGNTVNMPEICQKLRSCRLSCVQVDLQYLALALTVCECGTAFQYITEEGLVNDVIKLKEKFLAYVADHPPEGGAAPPPPPAFVPDPKATRPPGSAEPTSVLPLPPVFVTGQEPLIPVQNLPLAPPPPVQPTQPQKAEGVTTKQPPVPPPAPVVKPAVPAAAPSAPPAQAKPFPVPITPAPPAKNDSARPKAHQPVPAVSTTTAPMSTATTVGALSTSTVPTTTVIAPSGRRSVPSTAPKPKTMVPPPVPAALVKPAAAPAQPIPSKPATSNPGGAAPALTAGKSMAPLPAPGGQMKPTSFATSPLISLGLMKSSAPIAAPKNVPASPVCPAPAPTGQPTTGVPPGQPTNTVPIAKPDKKAVAINDVMPNTRPSTPGVALLRIIFALQM
ncbi:unnamed protein product [Caenorhabditis auriculariae]|uniref:Tyrosine-protein phosphatase domain-containing protein n=1 Tax=Caenorhabditis auriculariae TaxID=2777116 RepID=A0A8S1HCL7_9PELO|nr:unnamed protein product [Caenorhabditis auriculariae]